MTNFKKLSKSLRITILKNKIFKNFHKIDSIEISDMHSIAFITVDEIDMKIFRDALKPHRGELG